MSKSEMKLCVGFTRGLSGETRKNDVLQRIRRVVSPRQIEFEERPFAVFGKARDRREQDALVNKAISEAFLSGADIFICDGKRVPLVLPQGIEILAVTQRKSGPAKLYTRDEKIKGMSQLEAGANIVVDDEPAAHELKAGYPHLFVELVDRPVPDALSHFLGDSLAVVCHGDDIDLIEEIEGLTNLNMPTGTMLPASGTGSIAVIGKTDLEDRAKLLRFDHYESNQALVVEREFLTQSDPERDKGCGASAYVASEVFSLEVTVPGKHYNMLTRRRTIGDMAHYQEIIKDFIRSLGLGEETERKAG